MFKYIDYLPEYLHEIRELKALEAGINPQIDALQQKAAQVYLNQFLPTADLNTVKRWEKILSISQSINQYKTTSATGNPIVIDKLFAPVIAQNLIITGQTNETGSGNKSPHNPYAMQGVMKVTVNGTNYAFPQTLYSLPNGVSDTFDAVAGAGTLKIGKTVLNGSESWSSNPPWDTQAPDYLHAYSYLNDKKPNVTDSLVSTHFPVVYAWGSHLAENRIYSETASNVIYIFIAKAFLPTPDRAGLKAWLAANPVTVLYQLGTPATITGTPQAIFGYAPQTVVSANAGNIEIALRSLDADATLEAGRNVISAAFPARFRKDTLRSSEEPDG